MKCLAAVLLAAYSAASLAAAPAPVQQPRYFRQRAPVAVAPKAAQAAASNDTVVVNAASYLPGVSPGGLATIFGQNLSTVSGVVLANSNPFPTELAGVSVVVNGVFAPLFGVAYANGQDQISFQVPYGAPTGPGAAHIQVYDNGNLVADFRADSFTEDPGIFIYNGNYAVAALNADGSLIGPQNPARPGDIIVVYTTGLGPLSLNLTDGVGAPSNPLAYTVDPFDVVVDGERCQILFSGLAPGFVGLYQLDLRLPSDLRAGNLDLQILSQFANSGIAKLPVE